MTNSGLAISLSVPLIRQAEWYFCGPACIQMVAAFWGVTLSPYDVAKRAGTNEEVGTTHEGMVRAVHVAGFSIEEEHNASFTDVEEFLSKGIPLIVYLYMPEWEPVAYGDLDKRHYMVITGLENDTLTLNDPFIGFNKYHEGGITKMEKEDFLSRWRSEKSPDDNWLLAMMPKSVGGDT